MRLPVTIVGAIVSAGLVAGPAAAKSPKVSVYGQLTIGPGAGNVLTFDWQINDAGSSTTYPNAPGVPGGGTGDPVSGWSLISSQRIVNPIIPITTSGNLTWAATSQPGSQFDLQLETLLGPTTPVGTTTDGPMSDFDPSREYVWPFIAWQGTYAGPTDDATLTADTLFDTSLFANSVPATALFSLHFDTTNSAIDLIYTPVPEPGTLAFTGIAAIGWVTFWRRRWMPAGA